MTRYTMINSPCGELLAVASADGAALAGLYLPDPTHGPAGDPSGWVRDDELPLFTALRAQLTAYFAGTLRDFDVPLAAAGTPFQLSVWEQLRAIPYGDTWSYGELAASLGRPGAARAVGAANGRNPISIIVPCHRVIGSNGDLTGYGGGLPNKRTLLALEGSLPAEQLALA